MQTSSATNAIAAKTAFRVGIIITSPRSLAIASLGNERYETDDPLNRSLNMCGRVIQS
jgi:hypothetical protein